MDHQNHIPRLRGLRLAYVAVHALGLILVNCPANALTGKTRAERCGILQNQLSEQLEKHAGSAHSAKAATWGAKAKKLCADDKQSQGLRAYAKALQLLGVQPIDPK
jgi:hypothetical protein